MPDEATKPADDEAQMQGRRRTRAQATEPEPEQELSEEDRAHQKMIADMNREAERIRRATQRERERAEAEEKVKLATWDSKGNNRYWYREWGGRGVFQCAYCPFDDFDERDMQEHHRQVHGLPDDQLGDKRYDREGRVIDATAGAVHHTEPEEE